MRGSRQEHGVELGIDRTEDRSRGENQREELRRRPPIGSRSQPLEDHEPDQQRYAGHDHAPRRPQGHADEDSAYGLNDLRVHSQHKSLGDEAGRGPGAESVSQQPPVHHS